MYKDTFSGIIALFLSACLSAGFLSAQAGEQTELEQRLQFDFNNIPASPDIEEGVLFAAGDVKIMLEKALQVEARYMEFQRKSVPNFKLDADRRSELRRMIASQMFYNELLIHHAEKNKFVLTPDKLDARIEKFRAELKAGKHTLEEYLKQTGQSEADFRRFWSARYGVDEELRKAVTDDDVRVLLERNRDELLLRKVSRILISYKGAELASEKVTRSKDEAKAEAEKLAKELRGGADFGAVAKKASDCPSARQGGDFEFISRGGAFKTPFAEAAYGLKSVGDISEVLDTPAGFDIVKLTEIRTFESLKDGVRDDIVKAKFDKMLETLMLEALPKAKFGTKALEKE